MFYDISLYDFDQPLTILYVFLPYPITAHYYELVLVGSLELSNVRLASDHLLGVGKLIIGFVIEIAEGTSQIETAIHSAHVDHSSCILYAFYLLLTFRLMI